MAANELPVVLLLDNSPEDLELLQRALASGGYRILTAGSVKQALDMLTRYDVNIVISDHHMPDMSGVSFLARVRTLYPGALRVLISGEGTFHIVSEAINEAGIHKYLSKNWEPGRLRSEVREAHLGIRS